MTARKLTPKQVLALHIDIHHRRLADELPNRATYLEMGRRHGADHWRYGGSLDHWHGPQPNSGPHSRPDGWYDGTHAHYREETQ